MASSDGTREPPVEATARLVGWPWKTILVVLAVGVVLDLLLSVGGGSPVWPIVLVLLAIVSSVAVRGLRSDVLLLTAAGRASALSLAGTVGLGIASAVDERWAATDFGLAEGASLTLVLVACIRRAAGRQRIVAALVALAVFALPLRLGWSSDVVVTLLAALAVSAVAAAIGSTLRAADVSHRSAVSAMRRAEREEMARELHDVVAHHVTGMVVLTQAARALSDAPTTPERCGPTARSPFADPGIEDALAAVERAGAEALTSLRSMVAVLRSPDPGGREAPLEPARSAADLDEMVRRFRDSGGAVRVELTVDPAALTLPAAVQGAVHRVVQEALTNAARYARGADRVRIELIQTRTHAMVTVHDSGANDDAAGVGWATSSGGYGIVGMRERVRALGGSLDAGPDPGGGWTVRARVPL